MVVVRTGEKKSSKGKYDNISTDFVYVWITSSLLKTVDLVSDITDNGFTCDLTCFEVGSRGLITPENARDIDKVFSFLSSKPKKKFKRELSKLALLSSFTIWHARHEPAWGSGEQPLINI